MPRLRAALAAGLLALLGACGAGEAQAPGQSPGWERLPGATLERTEVAAARVGAAAYVVGGFAAPDGRTTGATERLDLRRLRWRRVAPIPQPVNHAAAAAWRGDLYVVGGYRSATGLSRPTRALWRYDPARDRWSRLPAAPTARGALAAAVVGNRLYAVGGVGPGGTPLRTLEVFDLRRRRWSRGPSMRVAREHLAATAAGGALYVLAGRVGGENFDVAERFVPRGRRWDRLPPMAKPRGGIAAATVGGRVVVVGGEEAAGTIAEVELFDPSRLSWRRLADLPTPRHGLGAVAFDGRVLALSGGVRPGLTYSAVAEALAVGG